MANYTNSNPTFGVDNLLKDSHRTIVVGSTMLTFAFISVVLRVAAKSCKGNSFGLDDLFAGFALSCYLTLQSILLQVDEVAKQIPSAGSADSHLWPQFVQLEYIYSVFYWSSIAFSLTSLLLLYRRIFNGRRAFSITCQVLVCLMLSWWLYGTICEAVWMQPVEARWDDSVKSSPLFDYNCFWHISMIIELLLEMAIFSLPAREVSKLEFDNSKIVLAAITALFGAVVIATGILRLYTFWSKVSVVSDAVWLSMHTSFSIIAASIPSYYSLVPPLYSLRYFISHRLRPNQKLSPYTGDNRLRRRTLTTSNSSKKRPDSSIRHGSLDGILLCSPEIESRDTQTASSSSPQALQHGVTRTLDIPSPVDGQCDWDGPSAAFSMDGKNTTWPIGYYGRPTKRAEFELKKQRKSESKGEWRRGSEKL